jgi:outer membrane protein assembly factor BamD
LALAGCAGLDKDETANWTPEEHYAEAKAALQDGLYEQAIKYYERLESRYPYGRYAQQAQIEIAYAYFKSGDPANAVSACDRFLRNHPNHANADYVIYLKGLATFNEDLGLIGKITGEDLSDRDPKGMRESFDTFRMLLERYPNSIYAEDSAFRLNYLINAMAGNELHVANYYFKRGAFLAAANRAQFAIRAYPEAPAVEQALEMMAASYEKLGLKDLQADALKVLALNFPKNPLVPKAAGGAK